MKILLYTISDFKPYALECIELLLQSITFDISCDFCIVSNTKNTDTKHKIITDNSLESPYIGYIKYSPSLPNNYDYYLYLDSDILYFDKISKLLPINSDFMIVKENRKIGTDNWYYFQYVESKDSETLQNSQAVNAGSFCYTNNQIRFINEIYELYGKYYKNNIDHDVRLEQSIYNYIINKKNNYQLNHCHDITHIVELYAGVKPIDFNKKLYHFCGFTNEMFSKFHYMKEFYDKYKRINT
jgi:hypothetical protein